MRRDKLPLLVLFVFSIHIVLLLPCGQAQSAVSLPPEAQKAFDRGLAAAQQQEWKLAVHHFTEAEMAARLSPPIMFNLGLAHGKAGHEVAGIRWLHAYLAAAPQAPNVTAVRKEITRLEVATEAKIARIFKEALAVAEKIPDRASRSKALDAIAEQQTYIGDIEAARQTLKLAGRDLGDPQWSGYGRWLGWRGDFSGAGRALSNVKDIRKRDSDWESISGHHTKIPQDLEIARKAAANIQDPKKREDTLNLIAKDPSTPVGREDWMKELRGSAVRASRQIQVVDLERALKEAGTKPSSEIPWRMVWQAVELYITLLNTRDLEKAFSQQSRPQQPK